MCKTVRDVQAPSEIDLFRELRPEVDLEHDNNLAPHQLADWLGSRSNAAIGDRIVAADISDYSHV